MNACISVACYKSKTLSNGENPLMLQVSKGGKRKYQSLGILWTPVIGILHEINLSPTVLIENISKRLSWINNENFNNECWNLIPNKKNIQLLPYLNNENTKFELKTVSEFYHELIEKYALKGNAVIVLSIKVLSIRLTHLKVK